MYKAFRTPTGGRPNDQEPMSATGHTADTSVAKLDDLPTFELSFHFDDDTNPETVTVFRPGTDEAAATQWITIDSSFAVSIDAIR